MCVLKWFRNTVCPTRYRTRLLFNNSNINEDIATKFEQEYVRCVRNEEECVRSAPNCCDTEQRSASQPACFLPGAPLCRSLCHLAEDAYTIRLSFVTVSVCVSSHRIVGKCIGMFWRSECLLPGSVASGTLCRMSLCQAVAIVYLHTGRIRTEF